MSCIENINKIIVPNDVINALTQIYKYIGKNDYYKDIVSSDYNRIVSQTIERDTYFLSKLIELDISDNRLRLIITKNSDARNREEKALFTLKEVLSSFESNPNTQDLSASSLSNLINYIYPGQNIRFEQFKEEKKNYYHSTNLNVNKREYMDNINNFIVSLDKGSVEPIILAINYIIDLYAIKPLATNNECLFYVVLYLLLQKAEVKALSYVSLFEEIYNHREEFDDMLKEACYNYNEGLSITMPFIRFMLQMILKLYKKADVIINNYKEDSNINKGDNIENTILNLPNIFTKDDIRANHPYVSESTINRALLKLREENIIKPLAKGRSAKWIKIGLK